MNNAAIGIGIIGVVRSIVDNLGQNNLAQEILTTTFPPDILGQAE